MAAEQASEEAQPRRGEAPGAGDHCIPRGWGAAGRGKAPRRPSACPPPTGAHARQGGALRPGAGGPGRRAGGRGPLLRTRTATGTATGTTPRPRSSPAPALPGGLRGSVGAAGAGGGGFPCRFLPEWERPGPRKLPDRPAHAPGDRGHAAEASGVSPAPRQAADRRGATRPAPRAPPPRGRLPPRSGGGGADAPAGAGPGLTGTCGASSPPRSARGGGTVVQGAHGVPRAPLRPAGRLSSSPGVRPCALSADGLGGGAQSSPKRAAPPAGPPRDWLRGSGPPPPRAAREEAGRAGRGRRARLAAAGGATAGTRALRDLGQGRRGAGRGGEEAPAVPLPFEAG